MTVCSKYFCRRGGERHVYLNVGHLGGRHHQDLTAATVDIDQTLAGGGRTNQGLAGPLDGEVQTVAPSDGIVAVDFQHVVVQLDLNQLCTGALRLDAENAAAVQTEVEQALTASGGRREVAPHNGFLLQRRIAG